MMKVAISQPLIGDLESEYVNEALKQGAISGFFGDYIARFENEFARYSDCQYGVSTTSGTTALHLAVRALGIGSGDEVLVSTLTNMASFFAVLYEGAKPVPIDIEADTLNLDPKLLEARITSRTKAILVVHLFGHPVDMDPVLAIAKKHNLKVIEDCAEAHGATYKGRKVGSLGDIGCFSFYANKIITTGEGGMITLNDSKLADKARSIKGLAFGDSGKYMKFMHKDLGYNYRMTNLQAAIGCAQMKRLESNIENKRRIAKYYNTHLEELDWLQLPVEKSYARNVYWMYHIVTQGRMAERRNEVMERLQEMGIETREGFIPYNMQEVFIEKGLTQPDACPLANQVAYRGFYLPSGPQITENELSYVVNGLKSLA